MVSSEEFSSMTVLFSNIDDQFAGFGKSVNLNSETVEFSSTKSGSYAFKTVLSKIEL